jgi:hypothetical protein
LVLHAGHSSTSHPAESGHNPQVLGQTVAITAKLHNPSNCAHSFVSPPSTQNGFPVSVVVVVVDVIAFPSHPMLQRTGQSMLSISITQLASGTTSQPGASTSACAQPLNGCVDSLPSSSSDDVTSGAIVVPTVSTG